MVDVLYFIVAGISSIGSGIAVFLVQNVLTNRRASDRDIFWRYQQVFDRPAFRKRLRWDSFWPDFRKAIDEVIKQITGGVGGGSGGGLDTKPIPGRIYIRNPAWRKKMDEILDTLSSIKEDVDQLDRERRERNLLYVYELPDSIRNEIGDRIDSKRDRVIETLNEIWQSLKISPTFTLPSKVPEVETYVNW